MIVKQIRIHHPQRSTSCRRLTDTANPGINRVKVASVLRGLQVDSTVSHPKNNPSRIAVASPTSAANNCHHQNSDRLDLVLKSKYLRNPEDIDCVKPI